MKQQQYLYVVLTKSNTLLSQLIQAVTHDEFTHASLALDAGLAYMFSFGRRYRRNPILGCFKRENLHDGIYRYQSNVPGVIIQIPVTKQQYIRAKNIIESFLLDSHLYDYNYLGLLDNVLNTPTCKQYQFLCSEFVYYVLNECGVIEWHKSRNLIRPQDFLNLEDQIIFRGNLKEYVTEERPELDMHILPNVI